MKRWPVKSVAVSLVAASLILAGCGGAQPVPGQAGAPAAQAPAEKKQASEASPEKPSPRLKVVASFYPLYYFASTIGGERVEVVSLVPTGVEPHDWEPKASDIRTLNDARVFVYNGAGFEPWVKKILESVDNKSLVAVDSSQGLELLEAEEHEESGHKAEAEKDDHGNEEHGEFDPHIWLDPVYNLHQVKRITDALIQADPDGRATYEANARALGEKLQALDREYRALSACARKEIVVSHAFFGYPAKRYGLKQVPIIASIAPDAEPTPKQLAELVKFVRDHQIKYIFFETLVSDKLAQVIASEAGARVLVLNPIEGLTPEEQARGKNFLTLMEANLANLKVALECNR